jgi:Rps23 Pro-64 3,4-dihydroxylase Tpa1-like proline 4-hydroxylase
MCALPSVRAEEKIFDLDAWRDALPRLSRQYCEAKPYPHILLTDFLDASAAAQMAAEFPALDSEGWTQYKHINENKLGMPKRDLFPPSLRAATEELCTPEFAAWLSELTGISGLMPDPVLDGGGLHQSGPGGYLNIHTDFSRHHQHKDWHRRVNLILYLNPGWREEWGGAIEFWERDMKRCLAKYPPLLNHALIFTTDDKSLHGFPDPLTCPPGQSRKSLALYYYTLDREKFNVASTGYFPRPEDGRLKALLIWLDMKAVAVYSSLKARFGLSDDFASRILGFLSRKK